jgi:SAM-dependent methyltransferase
MMLDRFRKIVRSIKNRPFKTADELYRKRAKYGQINEFCKFQVIASDMRSYSPPLLGNPFRSWMEKKQWKDANHLHYEHEDKSGRARAMRRFEMMYGLVKDRVTTDCVILDVGCNTGLFLDQWYKTGFRNLYGLDPNSFAVEHARQKRPYLEIKEGYFGPRENDIPCDLMVWFQSIFRVPYHARLFDAIDRCVRKYVLMWNQEALDPFQRDVHVGMARKGFLCIEKRVVGPDPDLIPIGMEGADGPLIRFVEGGQTEKNFDSFFLFRRIEPRA